MTAPDPSIAPGQDPDADTPPVDTEPRWVRYVGPVAQTVDQVGAWAVDETKQVAGWFAERLLQHGYFVEAQPPAQDATGDVPAEADAPAEAEVSAEVSAEAPPEVPKSRWGGVTEQATAEPPTTDTA